MRGTGDVAGEECEMCDRVETLATSATAARLRYERSTSHAAGRGDEEAAAAASMAWHVQ